MAKEAQVERTGDLAVLTRTLCARLVGARYELDTALEEAREHFGSDSLLETHIEGSLVDCEGAIQRLLAEQRPAACTTA